MNSSIQTTIIFFLLISLPIRGLSIELTKEEKEIIELQNKRVIGSQHLYTYLHHSNEQVRFRALVALANIGDTLAVGQVVPMIYDKSISVRVAAIFALSFIAPDTISSTLLTLVLTDPNTRVQRAALRALGVIGTKEILDKLTDFTPNVLKQELREELALCYAHFAVRGIKTERTVWHCVELLNDTSSEVRWKALYALSRMAPYELINIEIAKNDQMLQSLAQSSNPYVRMSLAQLLSRAHGEYRNALLDSLENIEVRKFNDWRVLMNCIKARAVQVPLNQKSISRFVNYIHHIHPYVRLTAIQSVGLVSPSLYSSAGIAEALAKELTEIVGDTTQPLSIRGEALVTIGKLFPLYFDAKDSVWLRYADVFLQRKRLEALSQSISQRHLDTLIARFTDPTIRIAMAAWDFSRNLLTIHALRTLQYDSARAMKLAGEICEKAEATLKRSDLALTTIVADLGSSLQTAWIFAQPPYKERMQAIFTKAYETLPIAEGYEGRRMILRALRYIGTHSAVPFLQKVMKSNDQRLVHEAQQTLKHITNQEPHENEMGSLPEPRSLNWSRFDKLAVRPRIEFTTTKGVFTIELFKEVAPATVLSIVELVEKKFYNGLTFHRVVPGFVVQGGDPRGDGWGGPGYTIRTEVYPETYYEEGMCGMASAGKDTEGSQFFVTHVPTPHLNGRYTLFGRVIKGMDVIQSIMLGDVIHSAKLVE
ncbi:MAG: peptidylprolyl isomerase [Bacteroidetes bacterium]|nr:peptidylprolyl isomerase [Bacteroidota bacterium]